jgi:multisite-specific tRNA:(cytosine-C5)-methyltransferase
VSFDKVEKHNAKLELFYNDVLGLPEEEKPDFWAALKRELPNSFRFAGSKGYANSPIYLVFIMERRLII